MSLGADVSTKAPGFPPLYIWAGLIAKLWANQPSPVLKACGFAVWASRMMPNSRMDYAS